MPDRHPEDPEHRLPAEIEEPPADHGPPHLEIAAIAVLLTSVVLAVVPATQGPAPIPWVAGMVMVLLSRRWGPADKGVALLAFGILGVPFVLLGRDELTVPASVVTGLVLVLLWTGASAWLLRRSRVQREEWRGLRMR